VKVWIASLAMLSLAGFVRANELDDTFAQLKAAQAKRDAATVNKLAMEATKLARAEAAKPAPADPAQAAAFKQRVDFDKQVETFAEYSLATTAASAAPAQTVELVSTLLTLNPKSQYLNVCASAYLAALGKQGKREQIAGAEKIIKGDPDNEDALYELASGTQSAAYAERLISVMKSKAKPQGVSDADWEKRKGALLGAGYYIAGAAACTKSSWLDCDNNLKAGLPYISKEPAMAGPAYFYLGLANYQLGKLLNDRTRIQQGERYSEQSSRIAGPMQQRAMQNAAAMRQELSRGTR
jgi:hypothetical protein